MTGWLYWAAFVAAAALFAAPYALFRWEERQERRDREAWDHFTRRNR